MPSGFDDSDSDAEPTIPRAGFDTLRDRGLSRSEVTAIRTYFASAVTAHGDNRPLTAEVPPGDETEAQERYRLEEEWIARQGVGSEYSINVGMSTARSNYSVFNDGPEEVSRALDLREVMGG